MAKSYLPARRSALKNEMLSGFDSFFDSFFDEAFPALSNDFRKHIIQKGSYPKVNVIEMDEVVIIEAAVPGMRKEDISIEVDNKDILTISGESQHVNEYKDRYLKQEIKRSKFSRSFALAGENLMIDKISAECMDGILKIQIPKITAVDTTPKVRKIDIG